MNFDPVSGRHGGIISLKTTHASSEDVGRLLDVVVVALMLLSSIYPFSILYSKKFKKATRSGLSIYSLKVMLLSNKCSLRVAHQDTDCVMGSGVSAYSNLFINHASCFPYLSCLPFFLYHIYMLTVAGMEVKLGAHVYYIVSMTTSTTNSLRHFSLKLLLHSSNSLTVARMDVKLGAHVYYIVSMTTTTTNSLRHFSLKLLPHFSNLLTSTHGGETWCITSFP